MKQKLREYLRVLKITKKPSGEEFWSIAKVSAIGLIIVGTIGFAIHLIANLV